ncbi:MAG: thiamine phosphate synthase [Deltaproteobacteria bacterium]|nr:thiamine phosphate synthase [Deltaproteobacteria bacterium]
MTAPRLLLISDASVLPIERLAALVERLAGALAPGAAAVYLREPRLSAREQLAAARTLVRAGGAAVPVFVRRRFDLALAAGAAGVHLQADGLPPAEVRAPAPGLRLGYSAHALDELARVAAEVDYLTFSPVFATPGKGPARGLEALRAACAAAAGRPVLALGGILAPAQARAAREAGAWGVATIRGVLAAPDPLAAALDLLAALDPLPGDGSSGA